MLYTMMILDNAKSNTVELAGKRTNKHSTNAKLFSRSIRKNKIVQVSCGVDAIKLFTFAIYENSK